MYSLSAPEQVFRIAGRESLTWTRQNKTKQKQRKTKTNKIKQKQKTKQNETKKQKQQPVKFMGMQKKHNWQELHKCTHANNEIASLTEIMTMLDS